MVMFIIPMKKILGYLNDNCMCKAGNHLLAERKKHIPFKSCKIPFMLALKCVMPEIISFPIYAETLHTVGIKIQVPKCQTTQ